MSELKTLKDVLFHLSGVINYPDEERDIIMVGLRVAAREWRLDLRMSIGDSIGDYTDVENIERTAQIEWIETFFNLEDEDE